MDNQMCLFCGIFSPSNEDCYCFFEDEENNECLKPHAEGFGDLAYKDIDTRNKPEESSMVDFEISNSAVQRAICESKGFLSLINTSFDNDALEHAHSPHSSRIKLESPIRDKFIKKIESSLSTLENQQRNSAGIPTLSQISGKAKRFKCSVCEKTFISKSTLKIHNSIHTGDKRFLCDICGKRFTHQSTLRNHLSTHTDENPYSCRYCEKKFRVQSVLDDHLRTHTNEKPFECDKCGKRFAQKSNLGPHILSHTGQKRYKCQWCDASFTNNRNCMKHQKREHPVK